MEKKSNSSDLVLYREALQRKPDLVLEGDGSGKRTWVEFKSWKYNRTSSSGGPVYLDGDDLNKKVFKQWNGVSTTKQTGYTASANHQHFLDFAASSNVLANEYWADQGADYQEWKPKKHTTWMQIWQDGEEGKRTWRALKKGTNDKYSLERKTTTRYRATSWIGTDGIVTGVPIQFQALQHFWPESVLT